MARPKRGPNLGPDDLSAAIFGFTPVLEALRSERRKVERVLVDEGAKGPRVSEILETCRSRGIPFAAVTKKEFAASVPPGSLHQGVAAFVAAANYADADDLLDGADKPEMLLLLDGIEDPRNLGAIIRTAECAGVGGVFIPERRAVGLTGTAAKASAGAIEHVPVAKVGNLNRLIEELKTRNIWVVGASGDAGTDYTDWDWSRPTALVMGAEGTGLHRLVADNCDALVKIPMYGKIASLNVSVAAGVILFEAQRQRNGEKQ